jgi:hypothetical protein
MRLYEEVAFGIEGDGADGHPVPGGAGPASWIAFAGLEVQGMSCSENRVIVVSMTFEVAGRQAKRRLPGVRLTEGLCAMDSMGHIGYRKWQVWKPLGFARFEAELCVPAL